MFQRSDFSSDRHAVVPSRHPETGGQVMEARHSRSPRATCSESIERLGPGALAELARVSPPPQGVSGRDQIRAAGLNRFTTVRISMTVAAR